MSRSHDNRSKTAKAWKSKLDPGKQYPIDEALSLVKEFAKAKFDESVDVAVNLGIEPRKSDQQVRGSTVMPNGIGKTRARRGVHLGQECGRGKAPPAPTSSASKTWPRRSRPAK